MLLKNHQKNTQALVKYLFCYFIVLLSFNRLFGSKYISVLSNVPSLLLSMIKLSAGFVAWADTVYRVNDSVLYITVFLQKNTKTFRFLEST